MKDSLITMNKKRVCTDYICDFVMKGFSFDDLSNELANIKKLYPDYRNFRFDKGSIDKDTYIIYGERDLTEEENVLNDRFENLSQSVLDEL